MSNAKRDENNVPTMLGVLESDGQTLVPIQINPANFALKVDDWHYGLVPNPDFADQPPFTAATNVFNRWIDGTAAGSTTDDTWGWATTNTSGSNMAARFTTTAGKTCINMVVTNVTKAGPSVSQSIVAPFDEYTAGTVTVSNLETYAIPVTPGQQYRFSGEYYLESVSSTTRISIRSEQTWYQSDGVRITTTNFTGDTTNLNTWTTTAATHTAPALSAFVVFTVRVVANGAGDFTGESATVNWTNLTITSSSIQNPQRALRDENFVPTLMGVSSVDGITPVVLYADSNGKLLIDSN